MTLMRDRYPLHIIVSMVDPLRNSVYTYKYRKIIILNMNSHYYLRWRGMTVYHAFNTFNLEDHLRSCI